MATKLFSFNLKSEIRESMEKLAKQKSWSMAFVIEQALTEYFKQFDGYIFQEKVEKPKIAEVKLTKEEHLADWEFRKDQVAQGKLPAYFADEYPNTLREEARGQNTNEYVSDN